MDSDTLEAFKVTLNAMQAVDRYQDGQDARLKRLDAEMAELRDEVHALANRIEAVTQRLDLRADALHNELHSVKVDP